MKKKGVWTRRKQRRWKTFASGRCTSQINLVSRARRCPRVFGSPEKKKKLEGEEKKIEKNVSVTVFMFYGLL